MEIRRKYQKKDFSLSFLTCILRELCLEMHRIIFAVLFFTCLRGPLAAQSGYLPLDADIYHWIDRADMLTLGQQGKFHSEFRPFRRQDLMALVDSFSLQKNLKAADRFHVRYFREVNSEYAHPDSSGRRKPLWPGLFRRSADALSYHDSVFDVHANIAGYGSLGRAPGQAAGYLINTRGVEVRGTIAGKVGFYSSMTDNQVILPDYVSAWTGKFGSLPHEGFWKKNGTNGYDFFTARGYICLNAGPHISFQAGHDRLQVGNGYRSMILSDFTNPFTFLRINTSVWKLQYTNLFASLKTDVNALATGIPGNRRIPGKLLVFHRLGMNIGKRFTLGLFEAVVAGKDPSLSQAGGFPDPSYFNPIIFYRAIEQNSGSPDNAGLGLDFKWSLSRSFRTYGQFFLDEFLLSKMKSGAGWWGNKYGFQAGFHYLNVLGIPSLDLQGEWNIARPFTYSHQSNYTSYSHYAQPLAHPLGANFREFLGILRYQPHPRVNTSLKAFYYERGIDSSNASFGSDVLKSYTLRAREEGNFIGQGLKQQVLLLDFTLSWQPWTNFFLDFKQVFRKESSARAAANLSLSSLSVRWNLSQRLHEF